MAGTNREALEDTIAALGDRVSDQHAALLQAARSLALIVDDPGELDSRSWASMWQRYQSALGAVMELGADAGDEDEAANVLELVRTPMGHTAAK